MSCCSWLERASLFVRLECSVRNFTSAEVCTFFEGFSSAAFVTAKRNIKALLEFAAAICVFGLIFSARLFDLIVVGACTLREFCDELVILVISTTVLFWCSTTAFCS